MALNRTFGTGIGIAATAAAFLLVSSVAPPPLGLDIFSAQAFAEKGGHGGGGHGGGGGGGGHGNSGNAAGNRGHGSAHGRAASEGAQHGSASAGHTRSGGLLGRLFGRARGEHAREQPSSASVTGGSPEPNIHAQMGALNAVHASAQAFENAAPTSRVGLLAAYAEMRTATAAQSAALESELAALREQLGDPAVPEAEKALLAEQIAAKEAELAVIGAGLLQALELAANKPVTPEVQAEVDRILAEKGLVPPTP
jgi:hypothetical protein